MPIKRLHSKFLNMLTPMTAAALALPLAILGLVGQLLNITTFKVIIDGMPAMSLATSISLMSVSAALTVTALHTASPWRRWIVIAICSLICVTGIINSAALVSDTPKKLLSDFFSLSPDNHVLYMSSPYTICCLFLLSMSLALQICARNSLTIRWGQLLAVIAMAILSFVFTGYLLSIPILFRINNEIGMAIHTMTALFLLCIGILNLHKHVGIPAFYYSPRLGSEMVRSILPGMWLLIVTIYILAAASRKLFSDEVIYPLLVVGTFIIATYELWRTAYRLNAIEAELISEHQRFQELFDGNPDAIIVTNQHGHIVNVNKQASVLTGYSPEQLIGNLPEMLIPQSMRALHVRQRASFHASPHHRAIGAGLDLRLLRADGTECAVDIAIRPVTIDTEPLIILSIRDLTEIRMMKNQIEKLGYGANHDPLTKLPNRRLLNDLLAQVINMAERERHMVAVCYCDLDGFKAINDTYGHQTGDTLLIEAANRMKATVRGEDIVARLGGDEFVIVLNQLADKNSVATTADKLIASMSKPYLIDGKMCMVTASLGISIYPQDGLEPDSLIAKADSAMYLAKNHGKNQSRFTQ
ncbi:MAG: sensor domain-containing diguanylate cyclase [Gallionella sp.]|nr:sensor domain-containing diguanylate cyclase [Gallionella sp.]MDD4945743.1 sensor domain-containing diguanylate cyclase [Gallionella sp.]